MRVFLTGEIKIAILLAFNWFEHLNNTIYHNIITISYYSQYNEIVTVLQKEKF